MSLIETPQGSQNLLPQTQLTLPPAPQLAEPKMETAAGHTKPIMLKALSETTIAHVNEINDLIQRLEELKTHLIESADRCKDQVARHFDTAMEASGFADLIEQRLADRINNPAAPSGTVCGG